MKHILSQVFLKLFISVTSLLIFFDSTAFAQHKINYANLGAVYQDVVNVFKSRDDEKLRQLCYRLAPDEKTIIFMRKHKLNYKGVPENLDERNMPIAAIGDLYYRGLKRVRNGFNSDNFLDDLSSGQKEFKTETMKINGIIIEGTETQVIFKSRNKRIFYLMGEMVKINGKWSLFTRPNTDYSIDD